jgi:hypothetical protein
LGLGFKKGFLGVCWCWCLTWLMGFPAASERAIVWGRTLDFLQAKMKDDRAGVCCLLEFGAFVHRFLDTWTVLCSDGYETGQSALERFHLST